MDGQGKQKRVVIIMDYTLTELANIYCISPYMMRNKIKKIEKHLGKRTGYYYQTEQVEKIFRLIMLPSNIDLFTRELPG